MSAVRSRTRCFVSFSLLFIFLLPFSHLFFFCCCCCFVGYCAAFSLCRSGRCVASVSALQLSVTTATLCTKSHDTAKQIRTKSRKLFFFFFECVFAAVSLLLLLLNPFFLLQPCFSPPQRTFAVSAVYTKALGAFLAPSLLL